MTCTIAAHELLKVKTVEDRLPLPCRKCGCDALIDGAHRRWGYTVTCSDCYDGPEDSNATSSTTLDGAIQNWDEIQLGVRDE